MHRASIQGTHVHLIVEAQSRTALAKGMQGFGISAAKQLDRAVSGRRGGRRRGSVFTDRYHARTLKTPREVRNCLGITLSSWRPTHEPIEQKRCNVRAADGRCVHTRADGHPQHRGAKDAPVAARG